MGDGWLSEPGTDRTDLDLCWPAAALNPGPALGTGARFRRSSWG